jgi:hypothetical protein
MRKASSQAFIVLMAFNLAAILAPVSALAPTGGDAAAGVITMDTSSGSGGKCRPFPHSKRLAV